MAVPWARPRPGRGLTPGPAGAHPQGNDPYLLAVRADEPYFGNPDALVDTGFDADVTSCGFLPPGLPGRACRDHPRGPRPGWLPGHAKGPARHACGATSPAPARRAREPADDAKPISKMRAGACAAGLARPTRRPAAEPGGRWSSACTSSTGWCRAGRQARLTAILAGGWLFRGTAWVANSGWTVCVTGTRHGRQKRRARRRHRRAGTATSQLERQCLALLQRRHRVPVACCSAPELDLAKQIAGRAALPGAHSSGRGYARAARMASRGAGLPVMRSTWPAAWWRRRAKPPATGLWPGGRRSPGGWARGGRRRRARPGQQVRAAIRWA